MAESYLPLRWESTGEQWWYASPIDWAAANGHYDVVRELLRLDPNHLIKLTSLRRIRRLETVWDDDARFAAAARNRAAVARRLLLDCEARGRRPANSLVRAGYGGWLLYTAASAGDAGFARELLGRQPLLVFGEGEYGVTDMLYAAARSRSPEVFRLLLDSAVLTRCSTSGGGGEITEESENGGGIFSREMVNRAVHAAARGGSVEILRELLNGCGDVSACRDAQGSTVLHAASARGQLEVVKDLVAAFDLVHSVDDQGNTALHIAAFRGHRSIVEALIGASPSLVSSVNNVGDTFLHMALTGFRTPGFRRLDRQVDLMKHLIGGSITDIRGVINAKNDDGRTVLHLALLGNVDSDLVQLLMTAPSIDLNVRDGDGSTPLDLLRQRPHSASSEILIRQLISAGGISNSKDSKTRSAIASQLKMQCIIGSPGTSFEISDAEIFLHAGIDVPEISGRAISFSSAGKSDNSNIENQGSGDRQLNSVQNAAKHLKILLKWPRRKDKKSGGPKELPEDDDSSLDSVRNWSNSVETPTPLRQRYSRATSLFNNRRTLATKSPTPSPSAKKKFTAGLMQGVIQAMPHLVSPSESPSTAAPRSPATLADRIGGIRLDGESSSSLASCSSPSPDSGGMNGTAPKKSGSLNSRIMNQYLCFGAQGLTVEDPAGGHQTSRTFKRSLLSVA